MDTKYRVISLFLFAIVIAIIGLESQIGALLPPIYATIFIIAILILRELVKQYGTDQTQLVMTPTYRIISTILIAIAFGFLSLEQQLIAMFPAYSTAIIVVLLIIREMVKDKGLTPITTTTTEPDKSKIPDVINEIKTETTETEDKLEQGDQPK